MAASAGVLGDIDRVVYSDLITISNDTTARIKVSSWNMPWNSYIQDLYHKGNILFRTCVAVIKYTTEC